jgi:hypothetical protein
VQFLNFNRRFNRQFKVSVAAIMHVSRIVGGTGGTRIMQGLVADTGEPWPTDFNWATPSVDLAAALRDTSLLGLVQIHSAIDDMLTGLQADLDRWRDLTSADTPQMVRGDDLTEPLESFYILVLEGSAADFDRFRPVLRYFRLARNCIAHRSGTASPAFADASRDPNIATSLAAWPKRKNVGLPPLPSFDANQPIDLMPRHAIFALQAAYESATILNRQAIRLLRLEGLAYLTARYALFGDAPLEGLTAYRSPQAVISDALSNRYRRTTDGEAVIRALKPLGVWKDCINAFGRVFGNPPKPRTIMAPASYTRRSANRSRRN